MKSIYSVDFVRRKLSFLQPKVAAVGAAVGSALTLLATSSFAQTATSLASEVNAVTGDIGTDVKSWIPGVLSIVGLVTLAYLAYKFIRGAK